jgi:hypothetical protein
MVAMRSSWRGVPKSISPRRPSASTSTLPGWGSAWKRPSTSIWRRLERSRVSATRASSAQDQQVADDGLGDPGPLDLDHHRRAAAQPAPVGLGDLVLEAAAGRQHLAELDEHAAALLEGLAQAAGGRGGRGRGRLLTGRPAEAEEGPEPQGVGTDTSPRWALARAPGLASSSAQTVADMVNTAANTTGCG